MRVMVVADIYFVEFSLYRESLINPNLKVWFGTGTMPGPVLQQQVLSIVPIQNREQLQTYINNQNPDLILFRNWVSGEGCIRANPNEFLWHQEVFVSRQNGQRTGTYYMPNTAKHIAYQSKPMAEQHGQHWLPYCVSSNWGYVPNLERDIPVLMATNLVSDHAGGDFKKKSIEMLLLPVLEWDSSKVFVLSGLGGGLHRVPAVWAVAKPPVSPLEMPSYLSRTKIYVCPTCLWYDPGCISYKILEGMVAGAVVLHQRLPGVEDLFGPDGENMIYSDSREETLDKVKYYLDHDQEREAISRRGREFVLATYGWEKHLIRLLSEVK